MLEADISPVGQPVSTVTMPAHVRFVRGQVPLILFGLLVALIGLLVFQWPTATIKDDPATTRPQWDRLISGLDGRSERGIAGLVVDLSPYAMIIAGAVFAVRGWWYGRRAAFGALLIIGLLGVTYTLGMVLFVGPMITAGGFTIVLFAALIGWSALPSEEEAEESVVELASEQHALEVGDRASARIDTLLPVRVATETDIVDQGLSTIATHEGHFPEIDVVSDDQTITSGDHD